jgi:hypothetical protein
MMTVKSNESNNKGKKVIIKEGSRTGRDLSNESRNKNTPGLNKVDMIFVENAGTKEYRH